MKHKFGSYSAAMMLVSLVMLIIVMCSSLVMADSLTYVDTIDRPGFKIYEYTFVMDSGGASTEALTYPLIGNLALFETSVGATAPSANYDLTFVNSHNIDVMGGALANRSASAAEAEMPLSGTTPVRMPVDGAHSIVCAAGSNLVTDATIKIRIWVEDAESPARGRNK